MSLDNALKNARIHGTLDAFLDTFPNLESVRTGSVHERFQAIAGQLRLLSTMLHEEASR
jgi:hypothetical protein